MAENLGPITADDIKRGLLVGKVRLVADGMSGTMCSIGDQDMRFYFGGFEAEDCMPWEYALNADFDEVVADIVYVLDGFRETFPDEWLYYRYVLNND